MADAVVSVVVGTNSELIREASRLYLPKKTGATPVTVADVTFGKGTFWTKTDLSDVELLASDCDPSKIKHFVDREFSGTFTVCPLDDLPYRNDCIDVVVLDPPYIHNPGNHFADSAYNNAKTTMGMGHSDIMDLYRRGLVEAKRVVAAGGTIWVKSKDQIENSVQNWSHIELYEMAKEEGLYLKDLFILIPHSQKAGHGRWKNQHHARKTHSYLLILQKPLPKRGRGRPRKVVSAE